jgi:hypothetical protein
MPAIFGITVPWITGSTKDEDASTSAEDNSPSCPQNAPPENTVNRESKHQSTDLAHTSSPSSLKQEPASDSMAMQNLEREVSTQSSTSSLNTDRRRYPLGATGLPSARGPLHLPRPQTQPAVSNPLVETQSQYHGIVDEINTVARGRKNGERIVRTQRSRSARSVHPEARRPRIYIDSHSSPNLRQMRTSCRTSSQEKPLKTCLKQQANTTTPMPACEAKKDLTEPVDHKLRRTKTVDFQKSKPLTSEPPLTATRSQSGKSMATQAGESSDQNVQSPTTVRRTSTCPSIIPFMKGDPAESAVTRTDVHVVATSPSLNWASKAARPKKDTNSSTPTMWIVDSGNGTYKVIWDGLPTENNYSPTAMKGLERVNTKLTEWSDSQSPSDLSKSTVVVYPEEGSHQHHSEHSMDNAGDNGDALVPPPNSTRTSTVPSRGQSHPASVSLSRETSDEEFALDSSFQQKSLGSLPPDPDQGKWSDLLIDARGRLQDEVAARRISQFRQNDTKFHGHRDSVTIAHDRLSRTMGTPRDLYAHRDSIALAKRRMHAKDHGTSGIRNAPWLDVLDFGAQADNEESRHGNSRSRRPTRGRGPKSFS